MTDWLSQPGDKPEHNDPNTNSDDDAPAQVVPIRVQPAPAGESSSLDLLVRHARAIERPPARMIERAKQLGGLLGEAAVYRFPVGGKTIEGASIDLAQALAQEWGGIVYSVQIVSANPTGSGGMQLHLRARVTDARTLVAVEVDQVVSTLPAPAKFARKDEQRERWNAMQIQAASSRCVRNAILRVLPDWYVSAAMESASSAEAAAVTGGRTLPEARAVAVEFLAKLGATREELERHVGQPLDLWAVPQLGQLRTLARNLRDGIVAIEAWRKDLPAADGTTPATATPAPSKSALGLKPDAPAAGNGSATVAQAPPQAPSDATAVQPTDPTPPPQARPQDAEAEAFEKHQAGKRAKGGAS